MIGVLLPPPEFGYMAPIRTPLPLHFYRVRQFYRKIQQKISRSFIAKYFYLTSLTCFGLLDHLQKYVITFKVLCLYKKKAAQYRVAALHIRGFVPLVYTFN